MAFAEKEILVGMRRATAHLHVCGAIFIPGAEAGHSNDMILGFTATISADMPQLRLFDREEYTRATGGHTSQL